MIWDCLALRARLAWRSIRLAPMVPKDAAPRHIGG